MIPTKGAHRGLDRKTQHIVEVVLDIIRRNVDNRARTTKEGGIWYSRPIWQMEANGRRHIVAGKPSQLSFDDVRKMYLDLFGSDRHRWDPDQGWMDALAQQRQQERDAEREGRWQASRNAYRRGHV